MKYTYICDNIIIVRDIKSVTHIHVHTHVTYFWKSIIPYETEQRNFFEY